MLDASDCRDHAKRCLTQAMEMTDPVLKESLSGAAQRWARLASDLGISTELLAKSGDQPNQWITAIRQPRTFGIPNCSSRSSSDAFYCSLRSIDLARCPLTLRLAWR